MRDKRLAFSMIELIMVIVVLGILSAMAIPNFKNDVRTGARENIYSALQYTRNLALIDNRTDPTDSKWQMELWHIAFSDSDDGYTYNIGSNQSHASAPLKKIECAIDPANGQYFYNEGGNTEIAIDESPNVFLGKKFGVNDISFEDGCRGAQYIAFDNLGRPFIDGIYSEEDLYSGVMTDDCTIIVKFIDTSIKDLEFSIKKETGFVEVVN
jgi:prepilin-type N-terminal cleavage/methylation domain-containing protein